VWCKACRDSRAGCNQHDRQKCRKCGNNISFAHIDLRYVGHAEATNRLLNVDPAWFWEPVACDEKGLPQYDANGGLWIRLTVCGVTRLGYGHAEGKRGGDAVKEIIGDAIRNAGMRFGMALDLWTSSDLEIAENDPKEESSRPGEPDPWQSAGPQRAAPQRDFVAEARGASDANAVRAIWQEAKGAGLDETRLGHIAAVGKSLTAQPTPKPEPDADRAEAAAAASPLPDVARRTADYDGGVVDGEVVESGPAPYSMSDAVAAEAALTTRPVDEHAAAESELRQFAAEAGIDDIDRDAEGALGIPLSEAKAGAIRGLLAQLRGTAA
jgi:hypothetical protein